MTDWVKIAKIEDRWEEDQSNGLGLEHCHDFEWLLEEVRRLGLVVDQVQRACTSD